MQSVMVYLAEPIDQATRPTLGVANLMQLLFGAGWHVYRPAAAWQVGTPPDPRIQQVNQAAHERADLIVAILPQGQPSIGVPIEIATAANRGTPVIVWSAVESFALAGIDNVHRVRDLDQILPAARRALEHARPAPDTNQLRLVLREGSRMPRRAFPDDAGIDLACAEPAVIAPGSFVDIPTDVVGVQTPSDSWLMVTGRSSTLRKRGLHVPIAVIDPGWRGPLLIGVWNLTEYPVKVEVGDRLAQVILVHNRTASVQLLQADVLDPHERGLQGFGSTGGYGEGTERHAYSTAMNHQGDVDSPRANDHTRCDYPDCQEG